MKNFVFISPNFPAHYWMFCRELRNNGMRVLGIGDAPYDELRQELKDALHEYFKVSSLENDEEVFRAVAFFTYKYGKIDWLESNNEYWLRRDAHLRTEFHITTGPMDADIDKIKLKSAMKAYYKKAGLPAARFHMVDGLDDCRRFIKKVGYPVIVKPDNGVGANNTYRLENEGDLCRFLDARDDNSYIMEEMVRGHVESYDAILDSRGDPIFEGGNVTPQSLIDVVNDMGECVYHIRREMPSHIREAGRKTVKAFGVTRRFVHLEFFVLDEDQKGLGLKGQVVGLEVNMRPSGGFTPDMHNYACDTNIYKIWADMVAFDGTNVYGEGSYHAAFVGRRDGKNYIMSQEQIMDKYGSRMRLHERLAPALATLMGDDVYIAVLDTEQEVYQFYRDLTQVKDSVRLFFQDYSQ